MQNRKGYRLVPMIPCYEVSANLMMVIGRQPKNDQAARHNNYGIMPRFLTVRISGQPSHVMANDVMANDNELRAKSKDGKTRGPTMPMNMTVAVAKTSTTEGERQWQQWVSQRDMHLMTSLLLYGPKYAANVTPMEFRGDFKAGQLLFELI